MTTASEAPDLAAALSVLMSTQALVVAGAFSVPILAAEISVELGLPVTLVGLYGSILFGLAALAVQVSAPLVNRFGGVRISQLTMVTTALGLILIALDPYYGALPAALLFGFSYGQSNTASGALLSEIDLGSASGFVFSVKQCAVPLGGMIAGAMLPPLSGELGWRVALLVLAVMAIAVCVGVEAFARLRTTPVVSRIATPHTQGDWGDTKRTRTVLVLVFFSLAAVQLGLSVTFVGVLPHSLGFAHDSAVTAFTIAMAVAIPLRLALGFGADRWGAGRIVLSIQVLVLASLASLLVTSERSALVIGTICLATALSWNGVLLSEVTRRSPNPARATSRAMTAFFVSGACAPVALGTIAGTDAGLRIGIGMLTVLCAVSLVAYARSLVAPPEI